MYRLLMLLPQSTAFKTLHARLHSVPTLALLQLEQQTPSSTGTPPFVHSMLALRSHWNGNNEEKGRQGAPKGMGWVHQVPEPFNAALPSLASMCLMRHQRILVWCAELHRFVCAMNTLYANETKDSA